METSSFYHTLDLCFYFYYIKSAPKNFVVVVHDFKDPDCLQRRMDIRQKHLTEAEKSFAGGSLVEGGAHLDSHEVSYNTVHFFFFILICSFLIFFNRVER
jgi:hypothetical protein